MADEFGVVVPLAKKDPMKSWYTASADPGTMGLAYKEIRTKIPLYCDAIIGEIVASRRIPVVRTPKDVERTALIRGLNSMKEELADPDFTTAVDQFTLEADLMTRAKIRKSTANAVKLLRAEKDIAETEKQRNEVRQYAAQIVSLLDPDDSLIDEVNRIVRGL